MAQDAFDPGPQGDYPWFPRDRNGVPLWSDSAGTDGVQVDGVTPMPRGLRSQHGVTVDVTPRGPGGVALNPPTRPPA